MSEPTIAAAKLLRAGVLDDVLVLLAADARDATDGFATTVAAACKQLGARTATWRSDEPVADGVDVLLVDAASRFECVSAPSAQSAPRAALRECLDFAWEASHAVANAAFIGAGRPGRIVYLAPSPGAEHADAARAGLENLARTLSIEWARHGVTTVAIAPGAATPPGEIAALCAYLASPAGAYFSGCLLDLRGV